jgi:outer membrane lipoprotein carrier protein
MALAGATIAFAISLADAAVASAEDIVDAEADAPAENIACEDGQAESSALRVQARYDGIRDIEADFEQQSQSASFAGAPLMDSDTKLGQVVFSKPGKMRWVYAAPDESVVVSDGETLWIHDVAAQTVTRFQVTQGYLSGAAVQFLLGDGRILDEFTVSATKCTAEYVTLDLLPKQDATYERLGLVSDPKTGDILETSLVDLFGNRTVIRFQRMVVNQAPDAKIFAFEAPEGVEVIVY